MVTKVLKLRRFAPDALSRFLRRQGLETLVEQARRIKEFRNAHRRGVQGMGDWTVEEVLMVALRTGLDRMDEQDGAN